MQVLQRPQLAREDAAQASFVPVDQRELAPGAE
jgi:hypothetical protein